MPVVIVTADRGAASRGADGREIMRRFPFITTIARLRERRALLNIVLGCWVLAEGPARASESAAMDAAARGARAAASSQAGPSGSAEAEDWVELLPQISMLRDNYLLLGYDTSELNDGTVVRLQISFKIRAFVRGLYVAFTQRLFQDLSSKSNPIYDVNYEPEVFYRYDVSQAVAAKTYLRWVQIAFSHLSNGREGDASRSWSILYVEALARRGAAYLQPRLWVPVTKSELNDDIEHFWGYGQLRLGYRFANGIESSLVGRLGTKLKGSLRADLNLPLRALPLLHRLPTSISIWLQLWHGFGDSLRGYSEKSTFISGGLGFRPALCQRECS